MAFYCILEMLLHVQFTATRQISLSLFYMESFYVSFLFLPLCDFRAYGIGKTYSLALFHPYGGKFCQVHFEFKNPTRFIELFLFVLTNFVWKTLIKLSWRMKSKLCVLGYSHCNNELNLYVQKYSRLTEGKVTSAQLVPDHHFCNSTVPVNPSGGAP